MRAHLRPRFVDAPLALQSGDALARQYAQNSSKSSAYAQRIATKSACETSEEREAKSSSCRGYWYCYLPACMKAGVNVQLHGCRFMDLQSGPCVEVHFVLVVLLVGMCYGGVFQVINILPEERA